MQLAKAAHRANSVSGAALAERPTEEGPGNRPLPRCGEPCQSVLNCSNGWRQLVHQRIERHGVGPKMFSSRVSVEPQ
jgi:hypothetical protein